MTIKREEREISGRLFSVSQLPAMKALKLSTRLLKIAGPAIAALAGTGAPQLGDVNVTAMSPIVRSLFDHITEAEVESITKELLASAQVFQPGEGGQADRWVELFGAKPCFDLVMGGDVLGVVKLLAFALEVNYADFFGVLRGALRAARPATPSVSEASKTSPTSGPLGDSSSSG